MSFRQFTAKNFTLLSQFLIFALYTNISMASSNYYLEEKISQSLKKTEKSENIVWLKTAEKKEILALLSPSNTVDLQGGVIILADLYQNPDWPVTVHGLRKHLPNFGWDTLSVQLPIPVAHPNNAELDKAYELTRQRIESAIAYFKARNINNINMIGINQSANFTLKYAETLPATDKQIQSIVCIRAYDSDWLISSELVKNIAIPLLDIYPEHDSDIILESAKKRLIAANFAGKLQTLTKPLELSAKVQKLAINKTGNLRYRQKSINGANYHFDKLEHTLFKVIRGWMAVYASGKEVEVN